MAGPVTATGRRMNNIASAYVEIPFGQWMYPVTYSMTFLFFSGK